MCTSRCHFGSSCFCFAPALAAECSVFFISSLLTELAPAYQAWQVLAVCVTRLFRGSCLNMAETSGSRWRCCIATWLWGGESTLLSKGGVGSSARREFCAELVRVVHRVMCLGHVSVRDLCRDATDFAPLRWSWCEQNSLVSAEPLALVNLDVLAAAKSLGAGTASAGCMLICRLYCLDFLHLLGCSRRWRPRCNLRRWMSGAIADMGRLELWNLGFYTRTKAVTVRCFQRKLACRAFSRLLCSGVV